MKAGIARLLCTALNSGEFSQGTLFLEHSNQYCVNGVLAMLSVVAGQSDYSTNNRIGVFNGELFHLSPEILSWAELKEESEHKLKMMNDKGVKFPELARFISENYANL